MSFVRAFLHFSRRDFVDSMLIWGLLFFASALGLPFAVHYGLTMPWTFQLLGVGYYIFSNLYAQSIWDDVSSGSTALQRAYLLSLPFSRRSMFWLTHARGLVGCLPFAFFTLLVLMRFAFYFNIDQPPLWASLLMIASASMHVQILLCRILIFQDRRRRLSGRLSRFLLGSRFMGSIFAGGLSMVLFPTAVIAALDGAYRRAALVAAGLSFGYMLLLLGFNHRDWMRE